MVHDIICWLYNINIFYCLDSISHCIIVHSVYFWSSSLILNIRILEAKRNTVGKRKLNGAKKLPGILLVNYKMN